MMTLDLSLGWHGGLAGGSSAAALPAFWLQQLWLPLAWGLVLALLVRWCVGRTLMRRRPLDAPGSAEGRFHRGLPWGAAAAVLLWSLWPGPLSVSYWLGLAFQAPSGLAVVLACGALWRAWRGPIPPVAVTARSAPAKPDAVGRMVAASGWWTLALLGWVLLLDTFAWWPLSLYAWGFGPQALGWVALASLSADGGGRLAVAPCRVRHALGGGVVRGLAVANWQCVGRYAGPVAVGMGPMVGTAPTLALP